MSFTPPDIPEVLRYRRQWLVWRLVQKPDEPKPRKVPFYVSGAPRNGAQGTTEDVQQLSTFDDAIAAVRERGYTGLGFALLNGCGVIALDFDHCVRDGQILDSRIENLVAGTYAEVSPSGTGLRAFFMGDVASRKDNAHKSKRVGGLAGAARIDGNFDIEVFGTNGFVTITGDATADTQLWGLQNHVAELSDDVRDLYVKRFGADGLSDVDAAFPVSGDASRALAPAGLNGLDGTADLAALGPQKLGWNIEQAREYLFACSASVSREEWVNALMAIHYEFDGSDEALDLADQWSATGDSYAGRRDVEGRWRSFGRRSGPAPITGRWLLAWRREQTKVADEVQMHTLLAEMQALIDSATDMLGLQTKVLPQVAQMLLQQPVLDIEGYALVAAKAKSFGVTITKTEFKKLVRAERPPSAASTTPLTEFGNTERMIQKYVGSLMYCPDQDQWFVWSGVYWRAALGGRTEIEHYAKETIKDLPNEINDHVSNQEEFFAFCSMSQRAQMVGNMVKLAQSDKRVCVPSDELDKHTHLLGVKNGVVNLRTGELLSPDPEWRITRVTSCEYNPGAKCPTFEKALRDSFYDDMEMVEYLARAIGYTVLGDPTEELLFIPFGNGANGKGTILNAVRETLGTYGKAADPSTFLSDLQGSSSGGAREDLVRLRGARFVYVNEPDEAGVLREGAVKSMTGNDAITARALYAKASIEILPTWSIWMPTNHKPIIKGTDNGIWRRLVLLPFERNFKNDPLIEKDDTIKARIKLEHPGILAFIVRAALRYQKHGLVAPEKITSAAAAYRSSQDLLEEWMDESCEIDPANSCTVKTLWESWELFARSRGMLHFISSSLQLSRRLDGKFPAAKGPKGVRIRKGLRVRSLDTVF